MISVLLGTLGRMARVVKTRISTIRSMSSNIDTSSSRIPQVNDIIDAGPSDPLLFYTNRLFSEPSISGPSISFAEPEMVNSRPEQSVGGLRRTESTMSISSHVKQNRISALVSLLYASIGGLCASHTLLITKLVVTLPLQPSILISSLVLAVVLLSLGQLYSLNKALEFSLPVLVLPLFFTVYTTVSLADSVVFFDPFSGSGAIGGGDIAMLVLGLLSIIGGVWVLRLG